MHVPEHRQQKWFHTRDLEDNAVEPCELEDRQPGVHWRVVHHGDPDGRGAKCEHKVEVVVALHEEAVPIRQMRDDSDCNVDVECDTKH